MNVTEVDRAYEVVAAALPRELPAGVLIALQKLRAQALLGVAQCHGRGSPVHVATQRFAQGGSAAWAEAALELAPKAGSLPPPHEAGALSTPNADCHRQRADEAEARLALIDTGCFNCGGLPHTTTCQVRDVKALLARAERAEKEAGEARQRLSAAMALFHEWLSRLSVALTDSGFAHLGRFAPLMAVRRIAAEAPLESEGIEVEVVAKAQLQRQLHGAEEDLQEALEYLEQPLPARSGSGKTAKGRALLTRLLDYFEGEPIPTLLACPKCGTPHVDRLDAATGIDWRTRRHRTHLCENSACKHTWRPFRVATVGVTREFGDTLKEVLGLLDQAIEGVGGVLSARPPHHPFLSIDAKMEYAAGARAVRKMVLAQLGYRVADAPEGSPYDEPHAIGLHLFAEEGVKSDNPVEEQIPLSRVRQVMEAMRRRNVAGLRESLGCEEGEASAERIHHLLNAYNFLCRLETVLQEEANAVENLAAPASRHQGERAEQYAMDFLAGKRFGAREVVARVLNRCLLAKGSTSTH